MSSNPKIIEKLSYLQKEIKNEKKVIANIYINYIH
jgi:hypothetical protein